MVSPVIVPVAPVTVAVQVEAPPMSTREGVQLTEVAVAASTVTLAVPELAALTASPGTTPEWLPDLGRYLSP